jgi:YidC/Oxa1 family membrane protein insertase
MILLSILTPLEDVLRNILDWLHGTVGLPWAWSIVALTVIVRMALVPLTVRQIHSMQNLQRHAPHMKELQRKYKGDRQKLNEELMKFYKENNINPAASCLPLVAQFPVFIALYLVLRNFSKTVERGADLSWLHFVPDISAKASSHWSGYVLIVVYVASQVASTFFMSTTMQRSQRTMMLLLPFVFVLFIVNFPTGLVLYWMTTNVWTVGQGLVTRRLVPRTPAPAPKRTSRTPSKREAQPTAVDGAREAPEPKATPQAGSSAPKRVRRKKKKKARR